MIQTGRFALLAESRDLATHANNTAMAIGAIDQLAAEFDVDPFEMKDAVLVQAIKRIDDAGRQCALAGTVEQLLDDAHCGRLQFRDGSKVASCFSKRAAQKRRDRQLIVLAAIHAEKEFGDLRKQFEAAKPAAEVLAQSPNDPAANLIVGKVECFWKNDWEAGVPKLAKGSDAKLQAIAKQESAKPDEPNAQVQILADAWWTLAGRPKTEPAPRPHQTARRPRYRRALLELERLGAGKWKAG